MRALRVSAMIHSKALAQCNSIIKGLPNRKKELQDELEEWTQEVAKLRAALPSEIAAKKLREVDIPALEKELDESTAKYGAISASQEEVRVSRAS